MSDVEAKLRRIIEDQLGLAPEEVLLESSFMDDFGAHTEGAGRGMTETRDDFIGAYAATLENGWRLVIGFYPRYCQRLDGSGTRYCCGYLSSVCTYDPEGHSHGGMQNASLYGSPHMYDDSMIKRERANLLRTCGAQG